MNDQTLADELVATSAELGAQASSALSELARTEVWAVCCSGGGIRSASYCLGALQALEEARFLDKARLIIGVSGGSYMTTSRALVAHGLELARARATPAADTAARAADAAADEKGRQP